MIGGHPSCSVTRFSCPICPPVRSGYMGILPHAEHVHLVCVPRHLDSLSRTLHTVHMKYARYFNKKRDFVGHLWQGRYFSCALDERHLYAAVRYVERNPVRGSIVSSAEDYPWSSAKPHIGGSEDAVLSGRCLLTETVADWRQYLGQGPESGMGPDSAEEATIIKATLTGLRVVRRISSREWKKLLLTP